MKKNKIIIILLILLILLSFIFIYKKINKKYYKNLKVVDNDKYHHLNYIYIFNDIYTKQFCNDIIEAGEETARSIGGWTTDRHKSYATTDIPVKNLLNKNVVNKIDFIFKTKIRPKIEKYYKVKLGNFGLNNHKDMFIVKYEHGNNAQDHLDFHRDGTIIS